MKMQTQMRRLLLIVIAICAVSFLQAQPGNPGPDPGGGGVPLDGGLSLLIAAGVGYAAKRKYDSRKKEQNSEKE